MLRAIATYASPSMESTTKPKILKSAQQDKQTLLFASNQLSNFEENTLPKILNKLRMLNEDSRTYSEEFYSKDEYQYVTKMPWDNFFMVICSQKKLTPSEVGYLFINIRHAQVRSELVKLTLNDIILNPIGYTGKDRQLGQILADTEQLKYTIMEALDKALQNKDKLDELVLKTEELKINSIQFNRQTKKLNRCCFS